MVVTENGGVSEVGSPVEAAELIAACAAKSTDHVTIAGCQHVDLLIDFLRRGFSEVGCQTDRGPHDGYRPSDVLVIPKVSTDLALLHVVARLGCDLRPGGTLVMRDDRRLPDGQRRQLLRLLAQRGYAPIRDAARWLASGGILCARKMTKAAEIRAA